MNSKLIVLILVIGSVGAAALATILIGHPVAKEPKRTEYVIESGARPDAPPDDVALVATKFFASWAESEGVAAEFHLKAPELATFDGPADEWRVVFRRKRADVEPATGVVFVEDDTLVARGSGTLTAQ